MPQRQSSLPRSTIVPHVTEVQALTDTILATRSWTVFPEPEAERTPNSLSRSIHRFRANDEHPTPSLSADWPGTSSSLSSTHRPSFEPAAAASAPEVSHLVHNPRLEEQGDVVPPQILHSPEGKEFRSSWEINVKKLVGDAVGNVNLIFHVEKSRYLINATSLDEYKSYFARHRSCSVCCHLCSLSPMFD